MDLCLRPAAALRVTAQSAEDSMGFSTFIN